MRLQHVGWSVYLAACLLVANVIGQYDAMRPIVRQRGLAPGVLLRESFTQFDVGFASVGLAVGVASLGVAWWVRRGR